MKDHFPISDSERTKAIAWLRSVRTSMLEVSPLSYWQKKRTARFLKQMPDWLMASCAECLNIDYLSGFKQYSDLAEKAKSDTGRGLAQQYLESHDAVPAANVLDDLVRDIARQAGENRLPTDGGMVERHVCALALARCTSEGGAFANSAQDILSDSESPNHPIVDYHLALVKRDGPRIEALDATLVGGRYGGWVAQRVAEIERYLGFEPPHFTVRTGERTPQWDLLWKRIFTGGDEN